MNTINLVGYNPCSIIDGEGLREVIYIAECNHYCKGCHNQKYWKDKGNTYIISEVISKVTKNPLTNITISGGDGLTIQYKNTLELLKQLKQTSDKNIWLYTGCTYEEIINSPKKEVLDYIDVLVDGKFEENKKDLKLKFRGSSNQRIINVKKSLINDCIIKYME